MTENKVEESVEIGTMSQDDLAAVKATLMYFLMFLDQQDVGLAKYPQSETEQVLFVMRPDEAVNDFVNNFDQIVNDIYQMQAQMVMPSEQDIVDQIVKTFSIAGLEMTADSTTSEEVVETETK